MFKTLGLCAVALASIAACSTTTPPATRTATAAPCAPASSASRIPTQSGQCSSTPSRTYSNEEIERTGQTDVGNALQQLDPSISVHH
jgi:hypothetical protein